MASCSWTSVVIALSKFKRELAPTRCGACDGNQLRSAELAWAGGGHRVALDQNVRHDMVDDHAGLAVFAATNAT